MSENLNLNAIDLFSGCGGLSVGMHKAGFNVIAAIEIAPAAVETYKLNHKKTNIFQEDIRSFNSQKMVDLLKGQPLHLLAGCPPCQGFSSVRRLNRKTPASDDRNNLVKEYFRLIDELKPLTIMMENVPALKDYGLFQKIVKRLKKDYKIDLDVVDIKDYGIAQRRKRLVMVGSRLGVIDIAKRKYPKMTVRKVIEKLESVHSSNDPAHKITTMHTDKILEMIKLIPLDGGSRKDLPKKYILDCHKKKNIGFNDIYGRLRWDDYSTTITGGCLNPSKGRFLHPEEHRAITIREAALIQSFPRRYKFPVDKISKTNLALQIGNALPPKFSKIQCSNIKKHIEYHLKNDQSVR
ncbi:MAG: DNA cytosine methyltransferase [Candidatus Margulisbacteria bacterium]|nr:DNA cytosine methyltransferase [Candidatus Margulisiibacteriota bacterium]